MAGMEVRLVNIHADAGADMGVFEKLHGFRHPGALADYLREAAATCFGVAGRAFLARMVEERTVDADSLYTAVKGLRLQFIAEHVPDDADGQVRSVAGRFGLIAAAGEITTVCNVLPWPEGEATQAASACFKAWLVARGGARRRRPRRREADVRFWRCTVHHGSRQSANTNAAHGIRFLIPKNCATVTPSTAPAGGGSTRRADAGITSSCPRHGQTKFAGALIRSAPPKR